MILQSLELENIRSYNNQKISFSLGATLFEGDIGSGKSTILMAIEFALFGLGSEKGGALLRAGAKKGFVKLKFEVEGKEYEVCRSLERKGKSIQQSDCELNTEQGTHYFSASEIKERILDILNFNEPADPKAQSVIYRYAIFTPQEEMKAILWMRADARLQTLRKAFRIEDYRIAADNCTVIAKALKEKSIALASHASDLETDQKNLAAKKTDIGTCSGRLATLKAEEKELEEESGKLAEEVNLLQKKKDALGKAVGEVPLLKNQIDERGKEIVRLQREVDELSKETKEKLEPKAEKLRLIEKPTAKTQKELREELGGLRSKEKALRKSETNIEAKVSDYESIEKNRICPTCDRPVDPKEFELRIEQKRIKWKAASEEALNCEKKINEMEALLESLREYDKSIENLNTVDEQIGKNRERIEQDSQRIKTLVGQNEEGNETLEKAQKDLAEFSRVSGEINELSSKYWAYESKLKTKRNDISTTQTRWAMLREEAEELEERIGTKEKERKLSEKLGEYRMWFEEFMVPTLGTIEKHVMLNINQEFNQRFLKWWTMLIEDPGKESRIDEDFTPIVEQDGYEQDVYYLSGGEKTSLALAYRLALNTIVQKVSTSIKSNLLILDEPTDGFSKEQLFKIRDILTELKCPQVIMVSHERELESFADHVLKVEKKEGVSYIKTVA